MNIVGNKDNVIICGSCDTAYNYEKSDLKPYGIGIFKLECPKCGQQIIFVPEVKLKQVSTPIEIKGEDNE